MAAKQEPNALRQKAETLAREGKLAEADALYQKLLAAGATAEVLHSFALFHNRFTLRFRRALPAVEQLLKLHPNAAPAHALAAETLANCNQLSRARKHADIALARAPDAADSLFVSALVRMKQADFDGALPLIDRALARHPSNRAALLQKARALLGQGDLTAALELCQEALRDQPEDLNFLAIYLTATHAAADDPVVTRLKDEVVPKLATRGGPDYAEALKLLGKAQNDQGDYAAAFESFAAAKAALPMDYDATGYAAFVDAMVDGTGPADLPASPDEDARPVLIVGMPRTGSTLIEQIMASHPQIASAGESPALHTLVQQTRARRHNGGEMLRLIRELPAAAAQKMAQAYLQEIDRPGAARVIDKSLHNFELLGVFAKLFPNARIIHMRRDPMDTCVSCYMERLSAWHRYTQSLEALGHAYVQYDRLVRHWQAVLPNPWLEVSYEETVQVTEAVARRLIDFCGLDWDPACLDFQQSGNRVQTLSARQVRSPLYTSSMQRWRRYEAYLDPLKEQLAPFYPDGFEPAAPGGGV